MKFIYKVLIGLIIFNSVLVLFSGFFLMPSRPSIAEDALNITDAEEYTNFTISGEIFAPSLSSIALAGLPIMTLSVFIAWFTKSPVAIGAGLFSSLLATLFVSSASVIYRINPTDNWIIAALIGLIGIVIGIIATIYIIEMFTGQGGTN